MVKKRTIVIVVVILVMAGVTTAFLAMGAANYSAQRAAYGQFTITTTTEQTQVLPANHTALIEKLNATDAEILAVNVVLNENNQSLFVIDTNQTQDSTSSKEDVWTEIGANTGFNTLLYSFYNDQYPSAVFVSQTEIDARATPPLLPSPQNPAGEDLRFETEEDVEVEEDEEVITEEEEEVLPGDPNEESVAEEDEEEIIITSGGNGTSNEEDPA